jgi:hypothetical protein
MRVGKLKEARFAVQAATCDAHSATAHQLKQSYIVFDRFYEAVHFAA